jgi:hypothetical protein
MLRLAGKRLFRVPLTKKAKLRTKLQKGNRMRVPMLIRWQFKMEVGQVLKVGVNVLAVWIRKGLILVETARTFLVQN